MSISMDIKALGEDIISSYNERMRMNHERIGMINWLQKNTRQTLKKFRSDRNEMAINDKNQRLKEVKSLVNATRSLLTGFQSDRNEMASNLHKTLNKAVAEIRRGTDSLLKNYAAERNKMAATWQAVVTAMAKKRGNGLIAEPEHDDAEANPVERKGGKKRSGKKGRK